MLLIDEPATGLHPRLVKRMGRTFVDLAVKQRCHIVVTTHRAELLRGVMAYQTATASAGGTSAAVQTNIVRVVPGPQPRLWMHRHGQHVHRLSSVLTSDAVASLLHASAVFVENHTDSVLLQAGLRVYRQATVLQTQVGAATPETESRLSGLGVSNNVRQIDLGIHAKDQTMDALEDICFCTTGGKQIESFIQPLKHLQVPTCVWYDCDALNSEGAKLMRLMMPPVEDLDGSNAAVRAVEAFNATKDAKTRGVRGAVCTDGALREDPAAQLGHRLRKFSESIPRHKKGTKVIDNAHLKGGLKKLALTCVRLCTNGMIDDFDFDGMWNEAWEQISPSSRRSSAAAAAGGGGDGDGEGADSGSAADASAGAATAVNERLLQSIAACADFGYAVNPFGEIESVAPGDGLRRKRHKVHFVHESGPHNGKSDLDTALEVLEQLSDQLRNSQGEDTTIEVPERHRGWIKRLLVRVRFGLRSLCLQHCGCRGTLGTEEWLRAQVHDVVRTQAADYEAEKTAVASSGLADAPAARASAVAPTPADD